MLVRLWNRFVLRGVTVGVPLLLLSILGIQCASWQADHSSHDRAKTRIEQLGGKVSIIRNCAVPIPGDAGLMTAIHLGDTKTSDEDLQFLCGIRRASLIHTLSLSKTEVSDAGMEHVRCLSSLG